MYFSRTFLTEAGSRGLDAWLATERKDSFDIVEDDHINTFV
jgi:hypothetical protein